MKKIKYLVLTLIAISCIMITTIITTDSVLAQNGITEEFIITFDSNSGSAVAPQTIESGKTVAKPTNPTRDGYTFRGWSLDSKTYDFTSLVTKNITLKAEWDTIVTINSSYLASLKVDNLDFDQAFARTNEHYTITVPSDTKTISIVATPDENSVIFSGTGKKDLSDGKNVFKVITKLKNTNDKEKTYTITITREKPDVTLDSLKVVGFAFKEAFSKDIFQYTTEVPNDIVEINVIAKATNSNASVNVTGGKNLVVGENKVIITVTYASGTKQDYVVMVTRNEKEEEVEKVTSTITSVEKDPPIVNTPISKGNTLRYIIITVGCFLLLTLAGLGIFFYLKTKKNKEKINIKAKNIPEGEELEEVLEEVELIEEELGITKEAPIVDHSDILDGIEDLLDEEDTK